MKSILKLLCLSFAVAFMFSSCSKKNELGKMIPKNAMSVMHLDVKSLNGKLSWDDIKQTSWYQKVYSDTTMNAWKKKLLENPENSGIDLNSGIIFFVAKDPGTEGEIIVEGTVKSSSDFEQFNKNVDSTATTKKDGDFNLLVFKNESVVTWNDKHFVYAFDAGAAKSKFPPMGGMNNQSNMSSLVDKTVALSAYSKKLFSLTSDSSLEKNEKFTNLLKEKGDIHGWVNTEEIVNGSGGLGMLGMLKLDVFLKDNISTYSVNFENGKIDIIQKAYTGKDFADFLKRYSGGGINTDMIKSIPSQNIFGVMALNYKPEALKELVKLSGMDGMMNMATQQLGFNLDDFVKANKGDLLLALTDLKMKKDSLAYSDGDSSHTNSFMKPEMNYLFSVAIGDKPSFQKLLDAGKRISGQMGRNDTAVVYGQNDKLFAVSNKQYFLNDYLAGKSNNKYDFLDKMSGDPVGAYVDIHKILTVLADEKKNNVDDEMIMNESLKLWNNVYFKGGQFKDGAVTSNTEINFMDQTTNSLKQLNHYFDVIAKVELAKEEKEKSETKATDSLMVAPSVDSIGHK